MQTVIVALPLAAQGFKRSNQAVVIALLGGNGNRRNVRPLAQTVVGVEHTGEGFKPALEALGFGKRCRSASSWSELHRNHRHRLFGRDPDYCGINDRMI